MKLIDIKDTLPVGFIPIQETVDTQEQAFRKRRLCIKFIPRDSTEAAICDIRILGRSKQAPPQYTFIGELNSMGIWYRMGTVPRTQESSHTSALTDDQNVNSTSTSAPGPPASVTKHFSMTLPASFRGKTATRPDYENQNSSLYAISAMDGVPFMISEKFSCASSESRQPGSVFVPSQRIQLRARFISSRQIQLRCLCPRHWSLDALRREPVLTQTRWFRRPSGVPKAQPARQSKLLQQMDLIGITIKTLAEIEKEYDYSFRTEHSAAARLPPSPTRTTLSSEA
ncbi:multivesicular body subunit 12Ba isoform X3 [Festucalex cinctus]